MRCASAPKSGRASSIGSTRRPAAFSSSPAPSRRRRFLTRAFREKTTRKIYWAIVVGLPKPRQGRIDLALAKLPGRDGERVRADAEDGKRAVTYYRVIDSAGTRGELARRCSRSPDARISCALIALPSARRSSATRNTARPLRTSPASPARSGSTCTRARTRDPASARRHPADHGTASPPHAAKLGILRLSRGCRGPFRGSLDVKRIYRKAETVPAARRLRRGPRRQARQDAGEARSGRAELGARRRRSRRSGRPSTGKSAGKRCR